eukprot:6441121-Prymnesium_polylepis.1
MDCHAGNADLYIYNDRYPYSTFEFMKYLMATWLHLPCLSIYIFDAGDYEQGVTSGNDMLQFGFFRLREGNETGIINGGDENTITSQTCDSSGENDAE